MRKGLGKTFLAGVLCFSMAISPLGGVEIFAAEQENTEVQSVEGVTPTAQPVNAYFRIIKEGQERPDTLDMSDVEFYYVDYGVVSETGTVCNDEETMMSRIVKVPDKVNRYLDEDEEVRWFTMFPQGYTHMVYGEIVKKTTPTPEVTPTTQPVNAYFRIIKEGQERPDTLDMSDVEFYYVDYGVVSETGTVCNDEETMMSRIVKVPDKVNRYLDEDEEVRWFTMFPQGYTHMVYGEIVKKEEVDTNITVTPTVEPAVTPTVEPAVTPTVEPAVTPTVETTETPVADCRAGFRILKIGQERPTTLDMTGYEFEWGNFGYIVSGDEVCNDVEAVESRVQEVPGNVQKFLNEDEAIRWFTIKKERYCWYVYGEIYNKNVENSDASYNDADYIQFDTYEDMTKFNEKVKIGTIFETLGYYKKGDGGSAKYRVEIRGNETTFFSCALETGQYANYVIENNTINMLQSGAGVCEEIINNSSAIVYNDDAARFNDAIAQIRSNGGGTIYFPEGEYRCASKVHIGGSDYTIKGDGNKSILYTDNGYSGDEHFLTISGGENIVIDSIRVEARETKTVPYFRQCSIMFSSNIKILNSEFSVKENVIKDDNNTDKQYTNITLYSGWHDVVVDNCDLEQMGCVERGACIGVIDMWSNGCSNATITNCNMKQNAHDEMMGIFALTDATAGIEGVYIANNNMYTASASNVSKKTMAITVSYNDSQNVKDVTIKNNYIKAEVPSNFMTFGAIENCVIEDNTIDIVHTGNGTSGAVFDAKEGVVIQNNKVTISSEGDGGIQNLFKGPAEFYNNNVDCDAYCYLGTYLGVTAKENTFVFRKSIHAVALSPKEMLNNEITVYGYLDNMIHYDEISYDSTVKNNVFNYLYDDKEDVEKYKVLFAGAVVYAGFHASLNDNTVTFSNNTINAPNCSSKNKHLLSHGTDDLTAQNFVIENNKVEKYKWVRSIYGKEENITFNNNTDLDGNVLNYDELQVAYTKDVE